MKFGVRDICDVVFKAKTAHKIGNMVFRAGQPVLMIDTAKTSTLESEATTVYANGGKGNARLIAWEGERTLTFSVTDALMSPMGMALLTGAGVIHDDYDTGRHAAQHVHMTATQMMDTNATIDLSEMLRTNEQIAKDAPVFVMVSNADGSLSGEMLDGFTIVNNGKALKYNVAGSKYEGAMLFIDFYVEKSTHVLHELQIDAEHFGGYYYVEANTLFRDQATGRDFPAIITLPNVKIQSNFTFEMSAEGDPSTFEFKMDAFPGYTMFDRTKKVLCVIQIVDEILADEEANAHTLMPRNTGSVTLPSPMEAGTSVADQPISDFEGMAYDPSVTLVPGDTIADFEANQGLEKWLKLDPLYTASNNGAGAGTYNYYGYRVSGDGVKETGER